jgi:hypothetical protein
MFFRALAGAVFPHPTEADSHRSEIFTEEPRLVPPQRITTTAYAHDQVAPEGLS